MTPARFIRTLVVAVLVLMAPAAHAQVGPGGAAATSASTVGRLNWPRTFAGQPDFEFSRADVLEDRAKQKNTAPVPTLSDLLEDVPLDPLKLTVLRTVSGSTVSGSTLADPQLGEGATLNTTANLPNLNVPDGLDLREFKSGLAQRLAEYIQNWHPDLRTFELSYLLRELKLNGVMTSPERRAIINGTTYSVGDQIRASVTIAPSDGELLNVLQEQLPASGTLTEQQTKLYQDAYEETVSALATQRQKTPGQYQRTFTLAVTVKAIQSRKVTLEFNGVAYDLAIPYAM